MPFWNTTNRDALLAGLSGTHCLATNGRVYVAYLPSPATVSLNLSGVTGEFSVRWFDPRNGGYLQSGSVTQITAGASVSLGAPPNTSTNDWVGLIRIIEPPDTTPPGVNITTPTNGQNFSATQAIPVSATVTNDVAVAQVEVFVDGSFRPPVKTSTPYDFSVSGLSLGAHTLAVVGEDTSANRATNMVSITVVEPSQPTLSLVPSGGGFQLEWDTTGFELQHALLVTGPWTNIVPAPASPYVVPATNAQEYFRLRWSSP